MSAVLAELEALLAEMPPGQKAELDKLLAPELKRTWLPNPGPQTQALDSNADLLLYGGAAGGGKTDLLIGAAGQNHKRGLIVRRESVELDGIIARSREILDSQGEFNKVDREWALQDGRSLKLGGMKDPDSWRAYAGRPRDFIGFDEGAEFLEEQVASILGWLRSTDASQRCRAILASNPPRGGEGEWVIRWFAPWLDPMFPNPAKPGELRWAVQVDKETIWVEGPEQRRINGEMYTPLSRTFIPAALDDNPYLRDTGYRAQLQSLPEPLRSQLLKGDFLAGREDHEWQVIPTEWVNLANERWEKAEEKTRRMLALAADIAMGGKDKTVLARLHSDAWFAPLLDWPGKDTPDPADHASLMVKYRTDNADLSADGTGGWGSGVVSHLRNNDIECESIVFSAGTDARTEDGKLGFVNLRAEMYWGLRDGLDPANGHDIKLPPDPRLKAELTTPRYRLRGTDILIEDKEAIAKRVGGSIDRGDAVAMAWHRRKFAAQPKVHVPDLGAGGWMA